MATIDKSQRSTAGQVRDEACQRCPRVPASFRSLQSITPASWSDCSSERTLTAAAVPAVARSCENTRLDQRLKQVTPKARHAGRERTQVVRQPDAGIVALLHRVVDAVGLDGGIVEEKAAGLARSIRQ